MTVDDYCIGETVQNCASRDKPIGRVVAIEHVGRSRCVVVEFPPSPSSRKQEPWRGAYDNDWLRIQEPVGGLRKFHQG